MGSFEDLFQPIHAGQGIPAMTSGKKIKTPFGVTNFSSDQNRNSMTTALIPIQNDLEKFLLDNQPRLDAANFARHGVPAELKSSSYDEQAPNFGRSISLIRGLLTKHPTFEFKYHTKFDTIPNPDQPIAILVSDIHDPAWRKEEINLLVDLYKNQELSLGDGLFESSRQKPLYNISLDRLIQSKQAADAVKTVLHNAGRDIKFYPAESLMLTLTLDIMFSSIMLFAYGPQSQQFSKQLASMVSKINGGQLGSHDQAIKLINELTKAIVNDLGLDDKCIEQHTLQGYTETHGDQSFTLPFIMFPSIMDSTFWNDLYSKFSSNYVLNRDDVIAEQFAKFQSGIHIAPIGSRHIPTLVKRLEEREIPVIVLSRKGDFGEPEIVKLLSMLDSENHHQKIAQYEIETREEYEKLKALLAQTYTQFLKQHS